MPKESQGMTLEEATRQGYRPAAADYAPVPSSQGMTLEEAQTLGFKPAEEVTSAPTTPTTSALQSPLAQLTFGAQPGELTERLKGIARSVGRVGIGALQFGQYLAGAKVSPTPLALEPSPDPNQQIGEKIGSAVIPASLASVMPSVPAQTVVGALTGGIEDQSQGGTGTAGAVIGGAVPLAAKTVGELATRANKATAPMINRWLQVSPKEMEHGANPAARLVDEGLVGATKGATAQNIEPALTDAGNQLSAKLLQSTAQGKTIDASNIVQNALDAATKTIGKRTDRAFQAALDTHLNDILGQFPDIDKLTPLRAQQLKVAVGDAIKWHGAAYEGDLNEALVQIYGGLNDELKQIPGVGALQSRWGDLYLASKSLGQSVIRDAAGQGTGNLNPLIGHALKGAAGVGTVGALDYGFRRLTR